ncbi:WD40-repeat-containing domain protein [Chytridium lagenaria]|nr:WD40-repeat-containing domain protein [Chytridium lagenaria]
MAFDSTSTLVATGSADSTVKVGTLVATLESHISVVRSLEFFADGEGFRLRSFVLERSVFGDSPALPSLKDPLCVLVVKVNEHSHLSHAVFSRFPQVWEHHLWPMRFTRDPPSSSKSEIFSIALLKVKKQAMVVTSDQNFLFYDVEDDFRLASQVIGYNEEVIDLVFLNPEESQLAVATNSEQEGGGFVVTGSEDRTIKFWEVPRFEEFDEENPESFKEAHEKDINSIAVSPNDKLFATGSQDKMAKIWSTVDGSLVGEFRGHRRGVWCVAFSTVDQVLASASADKTIKLWSLADYSCLKTFEGHLNSVLKVSFVSLGMQLLSTGSDGLLKLWNIRTSECVNTFDQHEDKVWALAVMDGEGVVVSGGGDARITVWRDCTVEDEEKMSREMEERVSKEQDLANCILRKDFKNAFILALDLDQPFRLLTLLRDLQRFPEHPDSETGSKKVDQIIQSFDIKQTEKLLLYVRDWNTNTRHAPIAQKVLHLILRSHRPTDLLNLPRVKEILDGLIAYTTRHLGHAEELLKKTHLLDYTLRDGGIVGGGDGVMGVVGWDGVWWDDLLGGDGLMRIVFWRMGDLLGGDGLMWILEDGGFVGRRD